MNDTAGVDALAIDEPVAPGKLAAMASDPASSAAPTGSGRAGDNAPIQNRDGAAASLSATGTRTSQAGASADRAFADDGAPTKPLVIGIAGGSGSGKTTVARKVAEALSRSSVAFIDMDAYYRNFAHLPMEERKRVNWDHPDAFDTELMAAQVNELSAGRSVDKPVYDFVTHTRSARSEPSASSPAAGLGDRGGATGSVGGHASPSGDARRDRHQGHAARSGDRPPVRTRRALRDRVAAP